MKKTYSFLATTKPALFVDVTASSEEQARAKADKIVAKTPMKEWGCDFDVDLQLLNEN